jgi:hypothetical protein
MEAKGMISGGCINEVKENKEKCDYSFLHLIITSATLLQGDNY